jgi:hypothetical protein
MTHYIIKSVSLTKEHAELCEKYGISLTATLRHALDMKEKEVLGEVLDDNASLNAKIGRLTSHIDKMMAFINEKGLQDAFLEK